MYKAASYFSLACVVLKIVFTFEDLCDNSLIFNYKLDLANIGIN